MGKTFVWTKDTTTNALKRNWNHIFSPPHLRRIGEEKIVEGEKTHGRRWVIERTNAWLKGFRTIRTRYFRNAQNYLAMLHFAGAVIIFRKLEATLCNLCAGYPLNQHVYLKQASVGELN